MTRRRLIIILILVFVGAMAAIVLWWQSQQLPPNTVQINHQRFNVWIATTPQQQVDGLAGVGRLEANQGMLFPLNGYPSSFWMKGMLIDLDIVWIKNNRVVDINANVPAPAPNTPDTDLPSYPSPVSNPQAVLEIAAGQAKAQGINIGNAVKWKE